MLNVAVENTASRRYSMASVPSIDAATLAIECPPARDASSSVDQASASEHTSFLARGLSRAEASIPQGLSDEELVKHAKTSESLIFFDLDSPLRAEYDKEGLDADDPEAVALAKQATHYLNGHGSNPFKGMSRDQLALIAYDESGTFTVNERRAARNESGHQESIWRKNIVAKANMLRSQGKGNVDANRLNLMLISKGGILGELFDKNRPHHSDSPSAEVEQLTQDIDDHFQTMPAIERAAYVVRTKALYS